MNRAKIDRYLQQGIRTRKQLHYKNSDLGDWCRRFDAECVRVGVADSSAIGKKGYRTTKRRSKFEGSGRYAAHKVLLGPPDGRRTDAGGFGAVCNRVRSVRQQNYLRWRTIEFPRDNVADRVQIKGSTCEPDLSAVN